MKNVHKLRLLHKSMVQHGNKLSTYAGDTPCHGLCAIMVTYFGDAALMLFRFLMEPRGKEVTNLSRTGKNTSYWATDSASVMAGHYGDLRQCIFLLFIEYLNDFAMHRDAVDAAIRYRGRMDGKGSTEVKKLQRYRDELVADYIKSIKRAKKIEQAAFNKAQSGNAAAAINVLKRAGYTYNGTVIMMNGKPVVVKNGVITLKVDAKMKRAAKTIKMNL